MNKLCCCGCGNEVNNPTSNFIRGHSNRSLDVKLKKKQKYLEHYGVQHPMYSKDVKKKVFDTTILKHGAIGFACHELKQKSKQTLLFKYGVEYNSQISTYNEHVKKTCLEKYGVEHFNQSDEVKKKKIETSLNRYKTKYPIQNDNVKNKIKETCLERYGTDNASKNKQIIHKIRIKAIKRIEHQSLNGEPLIPHIGNNERLFLDELQKFTQFKIIRNDPSFRYQIGRFPDGHIEECKLFIQFDERHHFKDFDCTIYKDDDIQCTQDLESIPGYRVLRVSEKEWNENKNTVIQKFQNLIISY